MVAERDVFRNFDETQKEMISSNFDQRRKDRKQMQQHQETKIPRDTQVDFEDDAASGDRGKTPDAMRQNQKTFEANKSEKPLDWEKKPFNGKPDNFGTQKYVGSSEKKDYNKKKFSHVNSLNVRDIECNLDSREKRDGEDKADHNRQNMPTQSSPQRVPLGPAQVMFDNIDDDFLDNKHNLSKPKGHKSAQDRCDDGAQGESPKRIESQPQFTVGDIGSHIDKTPDRWTSQQITSPQRAEAGLYENSEPGWGHTHQMLKKRSSPVKKRLDDLSDTEEALESEPQFLTSPEYQPLDEDGEPIGMIPEIGMKFPDRPRAIVTNVPQDLPTTTDLSPYRQLCKEIVPKFGDIRTTVSREVLKIGDMLRNAPTLQKVIGPSIENLRVGEGHKDISLASHFKHSPLEVLPQPAQVSLRDLSWFINRISGEDNSKGIQGSKPKNRMGEGSDQVNLADGA